jgi:hypothetical protein
MLKEEVLRRYRLKESDDNILGPRPKHWVKDQVLKWLHDNPIDGEADVLFLQREVEQHRQATASARSTAATENISLSNWTGNVPHLRLIHCVVDDSIKDLYRRRDNLQPGRMTVDSRNSSVREETVWEKISNLWNDKEFEPDTMIMTGLHPNDFQTSEKLSFHRVQGLHAASPTFVKDKLGLMTKALRRCIDNWERSGQGEGGVDPYNEDEANRPEFGSTQDEYGDHVRSTYALQCRHSFFVDRETYLLYFWEILEQNQLFAYVMAILPEDVAAQDGGESVGSVASTAGGKSTTPSKSDEFMKELTGLTTTILSDEHRKKEVELKAMEVSLRQQELEERRSDRDHREIVQKRERLYNLQDQIKQQKREIFSARKQNDNDWVDFLEEEMNGCIRNAEAIEEEIRQMEVLAAATMETPVRRNTQPQSRNHSL